MDCPVCKKRVEQGFSDCEQQKERLQAKNQRLVLALTVLGTLAGKEVVDYAVGLSKTVEQVISKAETQPRGSTGFASSVRPSREGKEILLVQSSNARLFSNVPPLTPNLQFNTSVDPIILPDPAPMMLMGLLLTPSRKRK
tara:strand:+ start:428 stop:847 length:420 start_codon:yes stop_codon:yes gene_type:complete